MKRYYSANDYFLKRFGRKMYKIALSLGTTCPNRDGTKGYGGCSFCLEGSGAFAEKNAPVDEQIERAIMRIEGKNRGGGYIGYFQSYTSTYGNIEHIERALFSAAQNEKISALSVGTRPDCLGGDVIALLKRINGIKPVFIELGLQTSNECTAEYINRCYKNECYVKAMRDIRQAGLETITHIIIGLPGETAADAIKSVEFACENKTDGIKLQLLHILRGTALAETDFTTLSPEEYYYILGECIEHIPENVVIHRLTGDGDKKSLIAPLWSGDKHRVINGINAYFEEHNIIQGSKVNGQNK